MPSGVARYRAWQQLTTASFATIGRGVPLYWWLRGPDGLVRANAVTSRDTVAGVVRFAGVAAVYTHTPGGHRPERCVRQERREET